MLTRQRGQAGSHSTWETAVGRQTLHLSSPGGFFFFVCVILKQVALNNLRSVCRLLPSQKCNTTCLQTQSAFHVGRRKHALNKLVEHILEHLVFNMKVQFYTLF